jgi:subtilisin family serine protease
MTGRYRLFIPEGELDELPPEVEVEDTYPAFAIVCAPEEVMADLRKRYPVEMLELEGADADSGMGTSLESMAQEPRKRGPYQVVARFGAPVREEWLEDLADAGYTIQGPIGQSAVVVEARNKVTLAKLAEFPHVQQVDPHVPVVALSPGFIQNLGLEPTDIDVNHLAERISKRRIGSTTRRDIHLPGTLIATFFSTEDTELSERRLRRQGVRGIIPGGSNRLVINLTQVKDPLDAIQKILVRPGLRRLEEKRIKRIFNDVARKTVGEGVVNGMENSLGLTGRGEIVAVADTGLDTGTANTVHLDFRDRVKAIQDFPLAGSLTPLVENPGGSDGPGDLYSGHGTHVSGSVLGNGALAITLGLDPIQGVAPEAELVFQAIEQTPEWNTEGILYFLSNHGQLPPSHGLFGIPDDLQELFEAAYAEGARIHSNSWGGGRFGAYDAQCEDLDQFVWEHKDFLVLVAAGNDGVDVNPPGGGIDLTSVTSPATAKNCLTVGASESHRPHFSETYGEWWPDDYPLPPYHGDPMADNLDDIVAFSSRGPCSTGRLKPDVVAPGTFVLSTRSSQMPANNFAWGAFTPAKMAYMYNGGTSMATPLVAGCAALLRQFLREVLGRDHPSAALLKAALIHAARYLNYRYAHPDSARWVDPEQGWGRVELRRLLNPPPAACVLFMDQVEGLNTGEMSSYGVVVKDSSLPLRVTMVYNDYPGEYLVNNLNLFAFSPGGGYYVGNDFQGAGLPDADNNVEGIVVDNPPTGAWALRVVASEVLQGPQDFALVVSGGGVERVGPS